MGEKSKPNKSTDELKTSLSAAPAAALYMSVRVSPPRSL
jgi:hypothetical protein